jgi:hypothetical protein
VPFPLQAYGVTSNYIGVSVNGVSICESIL